MIKYLSSLLLLLVGGCSSIKDISVTYILQLEKYKSSREKVISSLTKSDRNIIVIDYSFDGCESGKLKPEELNKIRSGKDNRKILSYLSIGEAEDYRFYWNKKWKKNKAEFLMPENPKWEGNFKVKYWNDEWQKIILTYLDEIIEQGFDGIFLDIVDGYGYFEEGKNGEYIDNKINPETNNSYRKDMILWVEKLATYAKLKNKKFIIIPQNAPELLTNKNYLNIIDGIALEDLFSNNNKKQNKYHTNLVLKNLEFVKKEKKLFWTVEYAKSAKMLEFLKKKQEEHKIPMLITNRNLTKNGEFIQVEKYSEPTFLDTL